MQKKFVSNICIFTALLIFFNLSIVSGQSGIKGYIKDSKGNPIPFSTLYIKELKTGTIANENGYFEFPMHSGEYQVDFRCLGYQSVSRQINVVKGFSTLDIRLKEQAIVSKTVTIVGSKEDPAYGIMRKAVAASYYYRMLVKAYDANLYIKGSGELKLPKLIYKLGKSEGLDTVEYFTNESYNHLRYEYPAKYVQNVTSARNNSRDSSGAIVNRYFNASIYNPEFVGNVSPLSPSAFSFYRFKLLNTFKDKGAEVYKIGVIPRSNGSNVFSGEIYIIDNLWCVYSFNLKTFMQGFEVVSNQMFASVNERVWVPINQQLDLKGNIFGFKVKWKYLVSLSDYLIEVNDSLEFAKLTLIDEKTEKEYAKALEEEKRLRKIKPDIAKDTATGQKEEEKFSLADFKKKMKEYEKQEKKKQKEPEVISDYSLYVDSTAYRKTTQYWDSIRPIPLTAAENKPSFEVKNDSIEALRKSDSAVSSIFGKTIGGLIFGKTFRINKKWEINYPSPLTSLNFNTVEGFNLDIPLEFKYRNRHDNYSVSFGPEFRYGFSNKAFSASGNFRYSFNKNFRWSYIKLKFGRDIVQLNENNPIIPFFNTITTLMGRKNYMKIYQSDKVEITAKTYINNHIRLKGGFSWSERTALFNETNFSWIKSKDKPYTSNAPYNVEDTSTVFAVHQAFLVNMRMEYRPVVKYHKFNGVKYPSLSLFPLLALEYNGGIKSVFGSDVDYQRIEASLQHELEGYRRTLNFKVFAGSTFVDNKLSFVDYKHFNGSKIAVDFADPMNTYRLLDYYTYSTKGPYFGLYSSLSMKKFLLSQWFWLNIMGVRECISFNYLKTRYSPYYYEIGYGLENIFRFIKIEAFTSFEKNKYKEFGIKLGISIGGGIRFERDDD
ncbi:MAG: DUF5686 and carboxypeptidase regulatory-like domain-containing protein [Bacteroidetes bacterium]|nr:DUF5686 and carboxypeptidase regulatory-like domain-containing protein [Bacteroidota bacterium]